MFQIWVMKTKNHKKLVSPSGEDSRQNMFYHLISKTLSFWPMFCLQVNQELKELIKAANSNLHTSEWIKGDKEIFPISHVLQSTICKFYGL